MAIDYATTKFYVARAPGEPAAAFHIGSDITFPGSTPVFVPTDDNLTDLGDATHRFRSLYLGTSIINAGNLAVAFQGGTLKTLTVTNTDTGIANMQVDGTILCETLEALETVRFFSGTLFFTRLSCPSISGDRDVEFPDASGTVAIDAIDNAFSASQTINTHSAPTDTVVRALSLKRGVDGGFGANGIGVSQEFYAENEAGTETLAGSVQGLHTFVGAGSEQSALDFYAGRAGVANIALRVTSFPSAVNYVQIVGGATGSFASVSSSGADNDIPLLILPKGTDSLLLADGVGATKIEVNTAGIGEFGVSPTARSGAIADAAGGAVVDAEARAAINALLAYFRLRGTVTP